MAFNIFFLSRLFSAKKLVESRNSLEDKKIVSIGYPDLMLQNSDIDRILPLSSQKFIEKRPEAMKWHGLNSKKFSFFSIQNFFESSGWTFEYLDIKQGTGSNSDGFIEVDLNNPLPSHLYSNYDILIDSGTAEHCFNIGKVFENYFQLLKPGGILIQYIPFLSPNHGFWSVNPTLFFDLADFNPIKLLDVQMTSYSNYHQYFEDKGIDIPFSKFGKFSLPSGSNNIILMLHVYKKLKKANFQFPVQSKYRSMISSS